MKCFNIGGAIYHAETEERAAEFKRVGGSEITEQEARAIEDEQYYSFGEHALEYAERKASEEHKVAYNTEHGTRF